MFEENNQGHIYNDKNNMINIFYRNQIFTKRTQEKAVIKKNKG